VPEPIVDALDFEELPRLTEVRPLEPYRIWLQYDNGVEGVVELGHLAGRGIFGVWSDASVFMSVRLDGGGGVRWNDDIDLCGDSLYMRLISH